MKGSATATFRLVSGSELLRTEKARMFELLARHFEGVSAEQFARDLAEKNLILLLESGEALVGFSTLLAYATEFQEERLNVIYSGDTIVIPEAWGTSVLPRAWLSGVELLRAGLPPGRCFWLLLTSGFRTYRFLPVFWREFFPRFDAQTPAHLQRLLEQVARQRFGNQFYEDSGIVRFHNPQRLRQDLQKIPAGRECDPHIAFFLARNPGHVLGDELVCLTELSDENLTAAGRRIQRSIASNPPRPPNQERLGWHGIHGLHS